LDKEGVGEGEGDGVGWAMMRATSSG